MCKELAKELRSKLKEIGYNRNMVSVTSDYDSINVAVKSIEVDFKKVEELANSYEKIDRDYATGEILCGCNTYVNVNYSQELIKNIKENYAGKAEEIFKIITERSSLERVFQNDNYRVLYSSELHQLILQQYEKEQDWFNTIERHCAYNINDIKEGLSYFFIHYKFDAEIVPKVEAIEESQQENNIEIVAENVTTQTTNNNLIEFIVTEDIDTRTNEKIFVAKLTKTVEYAEFKAIESKIKNIGGYYSRFKRGFLFKVNPTELLQKEFNRPIETVEKIEQPEIKINEDLARRSKENMSFDSYKEGSATEEYNNHIEEVKKEIEKAKTKVSDDSKIKLDNLLNWYKRTYANWINKYNASGANHVSVMISGASNYNMNKHNRYLNQQEKLWQEYNEIKDITDKIEKIVNGDKIIKSSDPNALEKLKEKLRLAKEEHQGYKNYNIKARKEGKEKLSAYVLQNSNARIKAIEKRIKILERSSMNKAV